MTIYAIVVTYNGAKWVDKCFASLVNSSVPLKILAIDNGSSDGIVVQIRSKFPQVEVIETNTNLGFGKANNIGLKRVLDEKADYAFLLNQDAWVEKDTIEKLVDVHQRNKEFGILSPIEYYKPNQLDIKFKKFYAPKELLDNLTSSPEEIYQTEFINAAAWLIPFESITHIGGFDPIFSHYGEDVDFCHRLLRDNKKIGIVTNASYFHDRPQILIKDSPLKKQLNHNKIRKILFLRWGKQHWFLKFTILIQECIKEIIFNKRKERLQYIKFFLFFLKNWGRIIRKNNFVRL
ncbi:glycosyltransferase family 2 protein [Thermophagus sp. OGC60D27]|uniref:glycosyltransferase family 2 protein n=1 Tax=Thermophagus sp. OGC60D27 TaxID=3458415 RepID=UPI004037AF19